VQQLAGGFIAGEEGSSLLRQPGDLFMERVEVHWGLWRGLHVYISGRLVSNSSVGPVVILCPHPGEGVPSK